MSEITERTGPASLKATMHATADQVAVIDLSDHDTERTHLRDLVSLQLGDEYASVSVLGTAAEIMSILEAATAGMRVLADQRKAAGR